MEESGYIWSMIKGDENHKDTSGEFACRAVIAKNNHHSSIVLDAVIRADDTRKIDLSNSIEDGGVLGLPSKTDNDKRLSNGS